MKRSGHPLSVFDVFGFTGVSQSRGALRAAGSPPPRGELVKLLSEKELKDASLLILANKQDEAECASIEEITDQFQLYKMCCGRSWHIQPTSSITGLGLQEGLEWLSRQLVAAGLQDLVD